MFYKIVSALPAPSPSPSIAPDDIPIDDRNFPIWIIVVVVIAIIAKLILKPSQDI